MFECITNRHLRIEPHKLRRHDAAGCVVRILQKIFELSTHFSTELRHHAIPFVQSHLLNDVSALVGGEAFKDRSHACGFELFENRGASPHRRLIAKLDAASQR